MDTVQPIPVQELSHLHIDPEVPVPAAGDGGTLDDVDDELIDRFVERVLGAPLLSSEIRHPRDAVARPKAEHGALAAFESAYLMFAIAITPTPETKHAVEASVRAVRAALEPWQSRHTYMNFAETRRSARTLFSEAAYHRLRRVKAAYDPENVIRSNHPIT